MCNLGKELRTLSFLEELPFEEGEMEPISSESLSSQFLSLYAPLFNSLFNWESRGQEQCVQSAEERGRGLNAGHLHSFSSSHMAPGPEDQSPALPSFSAAFCKALS